MAAPRPQAAEAALDRLRHGLRRTRVHARALRMRLAALTPTTRGILWALGAGLAFSGANGSMRALSLAIDPLQAQFLRYFVGLLPLLPMLVRTDPRSLRPHSMSGQLWRSALHTLGLVLWFTALPHMPLADMTAIGFTNPLFVLIGAAWLLREPMSTARWVAVAAGFAGVLVIVGPGLAGTGGWYNLLMLASSPVFAASFLLTKVLTRRDSASVIVLWQTLLITVMSLPLALVSWVWPTPGQWGLALIGGVCGTAGHYFLTRSFASADISATQSVKFVDLLWAGLIGWLAFNDVLRPTTLMGGAVIVGSIVLLARHESRRPPPAASAPPS
jgi:drug/metabolite transporter (DMT)-like permease